jgi:hypothetical protein
VILIEMWRDLSRLERGMLLATGPFAVFQIAPVKILPSLYLPLVAVFHAETVVSRPGTSLAENF